MNPALVWINAIGGLIGVLGPLAIDTAFKIKQLLELDPDIKANITNLAGTAIAADEDTIATINAWRAKHGIPVGTIRPIPSG